MTQPNTKRALGLPVRLLVYFAMAAGIEAVIVWIAIDASFVGFVQSIAADLGCVIRDTIFLFLGFSLAVEVLPRLARRYLSGSGEN